MAFTIQGTLKLDWLNFGESHDAVWTANAVGIGITAIQAGSYTTKVAAARAKYDAMIVARNAAKTATQQWYDAAIEMRDNGAMLLGIIKGFADTQADPNAVYALAQIPPQGSRTPAGPPTDCTNLTLELTNQGNVQLDWTGTLRQGQFFSVWRKLAGQSVFTQIGSVAKKAFLDDQVPQGTQYAQYQVRAHRGSLVSQGCEPVTILFGVSLAA